MAVLISYPCFKLSGHYFAIATFAIVEIFNRMFLVWYWVGGALGLDYPMVEEGLANLMWYDSKTGYYYCALVLFVLIFGIVRFLEGHRFGYYLQGRARGPGDGRVARGQQHGRQAHGHGPVGGAGRPVRRLFRAVQPARRPGNGHVARHVDEVRARHDPGRGGDPGRAAARGRGARFPLQEYTRALWGGLGGGVDLIVFGVLIIVIVVKQPAGISGIVRDIARRFGRRPAAAKGGASVGTA